MEINKKEHFEYFEYFMKIYSKIIGQYQGSMEYGVVKGLWMMNSHDEESLRVINRDREM